MTDATITARKTWMAVLAKAAPARLAALQGALKCGTNCGSCLPQLQKMVKVNMPPDLALGRTAQTSAGALAP